MIVSELMEILRECNCNAVVKLSNPGYTSQPGGPWVEVEGDDISYIFPCQVEDRHIATEVILER